MAGFLRLDEEEEIRKAAVQQFADRQADLQVMDIATAIATRQIRNPRMFELDKLRGEAMLAYLAGNEPYKEFLRIKRYAYPELVDYINRVGDDIPRICKIARFEVVARRLSDIATEDFLQQVDEYCIRTRGQVPFIPDMLGPYFDKLVAPGSNGMFFVAFTIEEVKKVFRLPWSKIPDLEEGGFIKKYYRTLVFDKNNRGRMAELHESNKTAIAAAHAAGACVVHQHHIVGIDLAKHKLWHECETARRLVELEGNAHHVYPDGRKSSKGYAVERHKDARVMWVDEHKQYMTAKEYAKLYECSPRTAFNKFAKLNYHLTVTQIEEGMTHE